MNLIVLQRIFGYNFVHFSLIYILPPNDRVLCSFVITERIPTSRPFINLTMWSIGIQRFSGDTFDVKIHLCNNTLNICLLTNFVASISISKT